MKKILIFGMSSTVGGVESYILNLYKNIDKKDIDISFLITEKLEGYYKKILLDKYNAKVYIVPSLKKHPTECRKMLKQIEKKEQFDVIHINLCSSQLFMYGYYLKKYSKNKLKIITHSHNGGETNIKRKILHFLLRPIVVKNTDIYLACSRLAAEWMYGKSIGNSNDVKIINNAIDTDKFSYNEDMRNKKREELGYKNNDFVIGNIGRFEPQKNQEFLINIIEKYKNNNIKLLMIGEGTQKDKIINDIEEKKLQDKVKILNVTDKVNEYYQAMDLFVMPSLFEGLPIVGIEAQTSGLHCLFSENITRELDLTKKSEFLPLNQQIWIKNINILFKKYENGELNRENEKKIIKEKGYELYTEINEIKKIYIGANENAKNKY